MELIAPQSTPHRTLHPGDVVVFDDGVKHLICRTVENDGLGVVELGGLAICDKVDRRSSEYWLRSWRGKGYIIYSADEWALKLVRKGDV